MPTYSITGQLLNSKQQPLPGFKIVAWDKDKKISDYLGTAYTGPKGEFSIVYDESRFFDGKDDNLPDVFFLVYKGDRVILSTEGKPIKNAKDLQNISLVIKEGETIPPTETVVLYAVEGVVKHKQTGRVVPGVKVEAWDKDVKICDQLGVSITNKDGEFYIQYDASRFKDDPRDDLPDLFFRLYAGDDMIHTSEGKPLKNVKLQKGIVIEIAETGQEDEIQNQYLPKTILLPLSENKEATPLSLLKKKPELYAGMIQKAQQELQKTMADFFANASYDLKYFSKTIDFNALSDNKHSVVDYVSDSIEKSPLAASIKNEAFAKLNVWNGPNTLDEVLQPERPIKDNSLFQRELQQAGMFKVAEIIDLSDTITEKLISRGFTPQNIGPQAIEVLVKEKVLSKEQGKTLNRDANIYTLSDGHVPLYQAIKNYPANTPVTTISDLTGWELNDWKSVLQAAQISADEESLEKQARFKQKQVEKLYPNQAFRARSKTMEDPAARNLMAKFYEDNKTLNFLSLDYNEKSKDLEKINLKAFSDSEKEIVLNTLKTNKRLYKITRDSVDTFTLKKQYGSANEMVSDSFPIFIEKTGFSETLGTMYYESARKASLGIGMLLGDILDRIHNPLADSPVENADGEINAYLRRLNGYEEFFGETDFCRCEHCASIISPVAYFVDLMDFLKEHVMDVRFPGAQRENNIISPYKRRSDLWNGLILNCENTHELVPYLTIINEILENFIYINSPAYAGTMPTERYTVENAVYNLLSRDGDTPFYINSFKQPFHLPLTQLDLYLQHFPISRASIAKTLMAYVPDVDNILSRSALQLSTAQYQLIVESKKGEPDFLERLYDTSRDTSGRFSNLDVQDLLLKLGIKRAEFTDLINTNFVTLNASEPLDIVKTSTTGDIQFNKENLQDATVGTLDRMHRFIRLWRQLSWSIPELDRVIYQVHESMESPDRENLFPDKIVKLVDIQKALKISTNDLCALIHNIPTQGSPSYFDLKFNIRSFVHEPGDTWGIPDESTWYLPFTHPAYISDGSTVDTATTTTLHRLLAGLGINGEELFLLIENLKTPLGVTGTGEFRLTTASLSILYLHALLLKKYKLKVPELFFLIHIEPSITENYISGFEAADAFIAVMDWYKKSNFSASQLAFILNVPLPGIQIFDSPETMAYNIWTQIQSEENLAFNDTLFSYVKGITESQSRAVIDANSSIIVQADLRKYEVQITAPAVFNLVIPAYLDASLAPEQQLQIVGALLKKVSEHLSSTTLSITAGSLSDIQGIDETMSQEILDSNPAIFVPIAGSATEYQLTSEARANPTSLNITVPVAIWGSLSDEDRQALYGFLLDRISSYILPGAPQVSDRLFVGVADLGLEASREIISANSTIFHQIESSTIYWLTPDFNIGSVIYIPADVPLPTEEARALLLSKHISRVLLNAISGQLQINSEKTKAFAQLSEYNFEDPVLSAQLTRIAQAAEPLAVWGNIIEVLQKLTVWFKDKAFTPNVLEFIRQHSGGDRNVFKANIPESYRTPSFSQIQEAERYLWLQKELVKEIDGNLDKLNNVLSGYDFEIPRFENAVLEDIAGLFNVEAGMAGALNNQIHFPNTEPSGGIANEGLKALMKFREVVDLVQFLGIGGEALPLFISNDFNDLSTAVKAVVTAIRTKYDTEEEWENKIGPIEDKIRERKRDALTDHLINTYRYDDESTTTVVEREHWFQSTNDLYNYFLIDTELMGCARTSRVVAGISSLQLYIQRCFLNLEQSADGHTKVLPGDIPADQWLWRKNYRVWEANRKVFLYPEIYLEPDLRDNKTELCLELESTLLQQQISPQNALDAYAKYLKGFDEVANLKIAGSYHHLDNFNEETIAGAADTLHLFGVTSSEPPIYYYRTIKNIYKREKNGREYGIAYSAWRKVNLQIPVKKVSPIIYNGKLYVFWVEIVTRPKNEMIEGTNQFYGYEHTFSIKFSSLKPDGTWQSPQKLALNDPLFDRGKGVIRDPLVEPSEINNWIPYLSSDSKKVLLKDIKKALKENNELINSTYSVSTIFKTQDGRDILIGHVNLTDSRFRFLLKPKYELPGYSANLVHLESKDDYTLIQDQWTRIFPDKDSANSLLLYGFDFQLTNHKVDLYDLKTVLSGTVWAGSGSEFSPSNKRLSIALDFANVFTGFSDRSFSHKYSDAYKIAKRIVFPSWKNLDGIPDSENILLSSGGEFDLDIVNGSLSDAIINKEGDLLYLHSIGIVRGGYAIERLNTTLSTKISKILFEKGLDGLLDINYQLTDLKEREIPFDINLDEVWNDSEKHNVGKLDTKGSMGVYFREIFFHIPFLIANHLNSQGKFADAQKWYHYIFNPTANDLADETGSNPSDRVWQYIEFRNMSFDTWFDNLNDAQAIQAYENDPFNPHAIARLRLGAYKKSILMKYCDNLLDWGDQLFAQDTMESINEATLLYVMASEILGKRPAELGDCDKGENTKTYNDLYNQMEGRECAGFLNSVEDAISETRERMPVTDSEPYLPGGFIIEAGRVGKYPDFALGWSFGGGTPAIDPGGGTLGGPMIDTSLIENGSIIGNDFLGMDWKDKIGDIADHLSFHTSFLKQACLFCIPPNPDLMTYWDRVEDRLFKIRNCMNISGVRRQIALFAPEIDPRLLVRAKAAGLSIDDVLNAVQGELPPYRFAFLLAKAKEYAGAVQSFGAVLLGVLEKKNGEELAMLRMAQQDEILKMTSKLRDMEIAAAESGIEGMRKREITIQNRIDYYSRLIETGLNEWEIARDIANLAGYTLKGISIPIQIASSNLAIVPSILGMSFSTPTDGASKSLTLASNWLNGLGQLSQISAGEIDRKSSESRREEGWQFSLDQANNELQELQKQIEAAEIRKEISVKSRELHEKSIEQHQETYEFYRDKFTNLGLYTWMSTQLQRMYKETYNNAITIARMAERAYRFERNDDTSVFLDGNYWEASRAGLMAGEKLMNALRRMELRYMETNTRSMEIDQAFSLTQISPSALLDLKTKAICEFTVPELYFDLFYPGQYRRQIKSARLTIPCITGPYSNVSAVMTLKGSYIRKDAKLDTEDTSRLTLVPASRSTTVATSTAQNDSGVFRLDFRDERYMPFEGAGAVESTWQIELPKNLRPFDYSTINDVILHISYTAEYDTIFRQSVEQEAGHFDTLLSGEGFALPRLFSLRQEFSQTFHQFLHSEADTEVSLELGEKHFPLFLQGRKLDIRSAVLIVELDDNGFRDEAGVVTYPETGFAFDVQCNTSAIISISNGDWSRQGNLLSAVINDTIFIPKVPANEPFSLVLQVTGGGTLAPVPELSMPSDSSALDDHKIKDVYLLIHYKTI